MSSEEMLTGTIIEKYLHKVTSKGHYVLTPEYATSLAFTGVCKLGKLQLSKRQLVFGPVYRDTHWMLLYINIAASEFAFINPLGASTKDLKATFRNWLTFVNGRKDLRAVHESKPFTQRVIEHTKQSDAFNCGVFICKFATLLLKDMPLSFDGKTIGNFRADILNAL